MNCFKVAGIAFGGTIVLGVLVAAVRPIFTAYTDWIISEVDDEFTCFALCTVPPLALVFGCLAGIACWLGG